MSLYDLTLNEVAGKIKNKEVTIKEVLDDIYSRIEDVEPKVDAYITLTKDLAYKRAELKRKLLCRAKDETLFYVLKGGAWNIPQSGCNKQTRMEIEYNDRFSNAGFRICVSVGKIE